MCGNKVNKVPSEKTRARIEGQSPCDVALYARYHQRLLDNGPSASEGAAFGVKWRKAREALRQKCKDDDSALCQGLEMDNWPWLKEIQSKFAPF